MKELSEKALVTLLEKSYEATLNGLPGTASAKELAEDYLCKSKSKEQAIDNMISHQILKCGTSGFLTGLGGIITLPVAIPANVASVIYVQTRMIAAIAYMNGIDISHDSVKSLVYVCLCGKGATDILKTAGIKIGNKMTLALVKKIPGKVLIEINKKVGFRLFTKLGQKGVINFGKMVPVAGGVIGAGFDVSSTKVIANIAKRVFFIDSSNENVV